MMKEIVIESTKRLTIEKEKNQFFIDGKPSDFQVEKLSENSFKVFSESSIYNVNVIEREGKKMVLSINNKSVAVEVLDRMDQILTELGMDTIQATTISEVKAPMPGSILSIIAKEGDEVKAGDQLLILEAMKMENVIKSPGDGIIDKIHVSTSDSVEKNQVLISFE